MRIRRNYNVGDIVKGKKILSKKHEFGGKVWKFIYKLECMHCHNVYILNSTQALTNSRDNSCPNCKYTYIINGKEYFGYKDIKKDFPTTPGNVLLHLKKHGTVSEVGKGYASKNYSGPSYKVGMVLNNRQIIGIVKHDEKNKQWSSYIAKCLGCGKVIRATAGHILKHKCIICNPDGSGIKHITSTKPREGRKLDLPKNITWSNTRQEYEVCVCAGGRNKPTSKRWREHYKTIAECLKALPRLKQLALEYKEQLKDSK